MSFAPASLQALAAAWVRHGGVNLGIVGDSAHPVGYHIGRDRIYSPAGKGDADYSVKQPRDAKGLTNAACALDLGKLDGSLVELRAFTKWLVAECIAGRAPWVREVIYSDDGQRTIGWSALRPTVAIITGYSSQDHTTHTHLSFWRDTVGDVPATLFDGYFSPAFRARIASGARIEIAVYNPGGSFERWSTATWGTTPSSAPCERPRLLATPGGPVKVARILAGKYDKRDLHVDPSLGVTVEAA